MELTETIETLNKLLRDFYGIDTITSLPIWRIVFSDEQFEKRMMEYSDGGILLLTPEVREVKKYPWIKEKYVLERLVLIPEISKDELPTQKLSYEPIWVFQDEKENYLPPKFEASKFIIDTLYAAMGKGDLVKYKDPELEEGVNEKRVDNIQEELYGEESDVTDALARGEAIVVPHMPNAESAKEFERILNESLPTKEN